MTLREAPPRREGEVEVEALAVEDTVKEKMGLVGLVLALGVRLREGVPVGLLP